MKWKGTKEPSSIHHDASIWDEQSSGWNQHWQDMRQCQEEQSSLFVSIFVFYDVIQQVSLSFRAVIILLDDMYVLLLEDEHSINHM
jgi:hypothetical protein